MKGLEELSSVPRTLVGQLTTVWISTLLASVGTHVYLQIFLLSPATFIYT